LSVQQTEIPLAELKAILQRATTGALSTDDRDKLEAAVDTLARLTAELELKGASIRRLRTLIFGARTERTSKVLGENDKAKSDDSAAADGADDGSGEPAATDPESPTKKKKKRAKCKGHGRNAASSYTGAEKKSVPHDSLKHKDHCPCCTKGKVYRQLDPKALVRVTGMAPLSATVYELERLRCNLCGEVFTAASPEGVGDKKYDETATSMIGMLKYGCGMPFNRLDKLEDTLGIPMPSSTQWELVERAADLLLPVYNELIRQAAQGELLHNDDTTMRLLDIAPMPTDDGKGRTGVYTSGIVSVGNGHQIALFFTGHEHAGENLAKVLAQRADDLDPPIQMCDGLSHNTAGDFESIVANCIPHARRKFVEVFDIFPSECRVVLETLRGVYAHEHEAKDRGMSPEERLRYHQEQSGPLMKGLETWLQEQFDKRKVEPNSSLGDAIKYMKKHWEKLTLFLRVAGAPLDNNICERILKKAILHRKNAYFYKTENGARVGDLFMSLIHTSELGQVNPFDYLVALQRHHDDVATSPGSWMPWNFRESLKRLDAAPPPAPG